MSAKEAIKEFIKNGGNARFETRNGIEGVLFLEEMQFISLDDLGYNSELGFFNKITFSDQPSDL